MIKDSVYLYLANKFTRGELEQKKHQTPFLQLLILIPLLSFKKAARRLFIYPTSK